MDKLFEKMSGYKTIITGIVAIISGIATILLSEGDMTKISAGWTQVLAGLGFIFLRQAVTKETEKVKEVAQDAEAAATKAVVETKKTSAKLD